MVLYGILFLVGQSVEASEEMCLRTLKMIGL